MGLAVAIVLFSILSWGLAHLWEPYTPHKPESRMMRLLREWGWAPILWDLLFKWRRGKQKKRKPDEGWWPRRETNSSGIQLENAGAIETHPAEAARQQ